MENVRQRTNYDFIPPYNIEGIIKRQSKLSFDGLVQMFIDLKYYLIHQYT